MTRQLALPTDTVVASRLQAHVAAMRTADGGWATSAARESDVESTSWVALGATSTAALAPYREAAVDWLVSRQATDGSWTFRQGPSIATWPTAPALFALTRAGASPESRARAAAWLKREHSTTPSSWRLFLQRLLSPSKPATEPAVVLDATLDGFGWARQTFAWVEPTALSMMALVLQPPTSAITERVTVGARLLLDRQSPDGGWNYGNKRVLGVDLPGYPDTTGWALLGLAAAMRHGAFRSAPADAAVARGFAALAGAEYATHSPLPIALALLAHSAHRLRDDAWGASLRVRLRAAVAAALDGVSDGYPMLDTRTAVFALLASHGIDVLAPVNR